jgi:large subunit ribosomal protein L6
MSRVAKNPISVPSGIEINLNEKTISVSGTKGKSEFAFPDTVSATLSDDIITVSYDESSSESTALAGTTRSLINNMSCSNSNWYSKKNYSDGYC